jgi:hypothetical protein
VLSLAKVPRKSNSSEPTEVDVVGVSIEVETLVKSKSTLSAGKEFSAVTVSAKATGELLPTGMVWLLSDTAPPTNRNPGAFDPVQPAPAEPQKLLGLPRNGSTKNVISEPGKALPRVSDNVVVAILPVSTLLVPGVL